MTRDTEEFRAGSHQARGLSFLRTALRVPSAAGQLPPTPRSSLGFVRGLLGLEGHVLEAQRASSLTVKVKTQLRGQDHEPLGFFPLLFIRWGPPACDGNSSPRSVAPSLLSHKTQSASADSRVHASYRSKLIPVAAPALGWGREDGEEGGRQESHWAALQRAAGSVLSAGWRVDSFSMGPF